MIIPTHSQFRTSPTLSNIMSLGIEIGNDFMVVTAVRQGVDVLQNDIGKRKTRVAVTYNPDERMIGDDSYAQYISKFNTSATYFKRLLGKQYSIDDEDIEKEKEFLPHKLTGPNADGTPSSVMFQIPRVGVVPPEQALCTMLLKAKQIYEINSENQPVQECVITVPTYFNNAQRAAVMNAAQMANLKVLELTNETTAILYQYGLQRQITDSRLVMFFDMGATTTSCTLARITAETAEVLAYEANPHLGGRNFIECIVEDVAKWILEKKKVTIEPNSKAWIKLRRACEKTFHNLSANTSASVSVENVTEDVDVSLSYTRESFYKILEDRFKDAILEPLQKVVAQYPDLMKDGKLQVNYFEIIGGVTRVPFVQKLITDSYHITLSKTLDADEAIARGAALRCAALSTTKRIRRKFQVIEKKLAVDLTLYSLPEDKKDIKEDSPLDNINFTEENILSTKSFGAAYPTTYPQSRLLSLKFQQVQLPIVVGIKLNGAKVDTLRALVLPQSRHDGRLLSETPEGNVPVDIKISLALNSSGYMSVYNVETIPPKIEAPAPVEAVQAAPTMGDGEPVPAQAPAPAQAAEGEAGAAPAPQGEAAPVADAAPTMTDAPTPVPTPVAKPIPLCISNHSLGNITSKQLDEARQSEAKLQERDVATRRRQEVYNNLESFLFTTRSRLNDSNDLPKYMTAEDSATASAEIKALLNWVDDEAYAASLEELQKKLEDAKKYTAAAEVRARDHKNLESSQFAYSATLETVLGHQYAGVEKFAKQLPQHQEMNKKAIDALSVYLDKLPVTSQQVDQYHTHLRSLLHAMSQYDPVKEAEMLHRKQQEEERKKAEEERKKAEEEAKKAVEAAAATTAAAAPSSDAAPSETMTDEATAATDEVMTDEAAPVPTTESA